MKLLFLLLAVVALAGCAGSAPDVDFRSKVLSDTQSVNVTPLGFTASNTIVFRQPPAKGGTAK